VLFKSCGCVDRVKKVGCLPFGRIKKHTPGLCASLPISFRSCISWPAMHPPFGCSTLFRSLSWFFPAYGRSRPALYWCMAQHSCTPFAPLRFEMAALISCALFHCGTTHSFATPLRCAYSSFSRALPCPQGFHIVHVRPPAAYCGCGCIFVCLLNNIKCIAALWVQVCPTGGRQAKQKIALRITDWCLPVRSSQSRPQPAVGYGAGRRISDDKQYVC